MIHRRFITLLSFLALLIFGGAAAFGQATKVVIETAADGSGSLVGDANLTAGQSITVYAISRDAADAFVENVQADTWTLINVTGGVVAGDLNPAGNMKSATFTARKVGSAQIRTTEGVLTPGISGIQTVIAGAPTRVAVETLADGTGTVVPAQNVSSGSSVTGYAITRDAFDNFVANAAATTWDLASMTSGVVQGDLTASGDGKSAQFLGALVGTAQVRAAIGGLTSGLSGTLTVIPGPSAQLEFGTQPTSTTSGTAISPAVTVRVLDAAGNLRTTSTRNVTLALGSNPGGGTLSGTLTVAAVAGVATFSNLSIDKVGTGYTLVASSLLPAPAITQDTSNPFNIAAGAATQLVFVQQPNNAVSGAAISPAVTVQLLDAAGNLVTAPQRNVTVALGANPGGGTLSGTLTVATVSGLATFSNLSVDKTGNGYTLVASSASPAPPLTQATSNAFNIAGGVATQLFFVQHPTNEVSGATISPAVTVQLRDAAGNNVFGPERSVTIALGSNPGSGTLSGTLTVTTVNGLATFSNLSIDKVGIGYTLVATSPSPAPPLTQATSNAFNIAAGAAAQLVFVQQPGNGVSGTALSPAVTVQLLDAAGNLVTAPQRNVTVALGANPGGGTLTGTLTVATVNGLATFSTLTIDKVGTGYTLVASSATPAPPLAQATSTPFNIGAGAATQLVFVQQPNNAVSATAISPAVTVQLLDAAGNLVTAPQRNVTVALGANPGGGTLGGTLTVATVNGLATFNNLTIDKIGTGYTLVMSSASPAPPLTQATSNAFNITAGVPAQLAFAQQPTNDSSGTVIDPAVTVEVRDAAGNLVIGSTRSVTVALGSNPSGATLSGTLTVSAVGGIATFGNLSIDKVGVGYTLVATSPTPAPPLTQATSNAFNIVAGAAAQLVFVQQPNNAVSGVAIAPAVTVQLQDAAGNLVTAPQRNVTIAIGTNPGGGILSGTLTVATVNGLATFSNLSIDKVGNGYTLVATSPAPAPPLTQATSNGFVITAGAASRLVYVQPPTNTAAGMEINPDVTVQLVDAAGNFVTAPQRNVTVALGANPGGGTLTGTLTVATVNGLATFSNLSIDKVGVGYTLVVSSAAPAPPLTQATSPAFDIIFGVPTQLVFAQQPTNDSSGTVIDPPVTVQIRDAAGNLVASSTRNVTIALGTNPVGGTLSGTLTVAAVGGVATFSNLMIDKAGNGYTLVASSPAPNPPLAQATSSPFNITFGVATQLVYVQQPTSDSSNSVIDPAVTVQLLDAAGNIVTGPQRNVTIALGANPSAGVLGGTLTVATVNGLATFNDLTIDKAGVGYTLVAASPAPGPALTPVTSSAITITAAAAAKLAFVQQPTDDSSGVAITPAVRVQLQDAAGNPVTAPERSVTISLGSNPGSGTLSGATTVTTVNGVATFSSLSIDKVGNGYTLVASSPAPAPPLTPATSSPFNVVPGVARRLVIQGPVQMIAGVPGDLTITALDVGGNLATGYTGNKNLIFSGADPSPSPSEPPEVVDRNGTRVDFGGITVIRFTNGIATVTAGSNGVLYLYKVQPATISVADPGLLIGSGGTGDLLVNVLPGPLGRFQFVLATPQTSGVAFQGANTLTALDEYGNVSTQFSAGADSVTIRPDTPLVGTVSGLGTGGSNTLDRASDFVDGVADLSARVTYVGLSGTGQFTATSSTGKTGSSGNVQVKPGVATRLVVTGSPAMIAGDAQTITVTAKDVSGNTVLGYEGAKSLTFTGANPSPDPAVTPTVADGTGTPVPFGQPATITFTAGVATRPMALYRAETATVSVSDSTLGSANGDRLTVSVGRAQFAKFILVLHTPQLNAVPFTGTNAVAATDGFGNTVTDFSAESDNVAFTSTLSGGIAGLGSLGNNVLNQSSDFVNGVADLAGKLKYTGEAGTGSFTATAVSGPSGSISGILVSNPAPTFATLSPTTGNRTSVDTLTVTGTEFIRGVTTISLGDSIALDTVLVESPTRLRAAVRISRGAALGPRSVDVINPGPGGGIATIAGVYTITDIPKLASVSPPNAVRGQTLDLLFTGTNFQAGVSTLGLVGANILVNSQTVLNDRQLRANVTVTLDAADGIRQFTVTNTGQYGGTSNPMAFSVGLNPAPSVETANPRTVRRLQTVVVTVTGDNFYTGLTSVDPGPGIRVISTTIDTVFRLRTTLQISDTAALGLRPLSVINAAPGGGTATLDDGLSVSNPIPTIVNLVPQSGSRLQTKDVAVSGTNFIAGVTSLDLGPDITVNSLTVSSPTALSASITVAGTAAIGARNVIVKNESPGGGADTLENAFTVNNPGALLTNLSVSSVLIGSPNLNIQLTGEAFVAESIVRLDSLDLATGFVSPTILNAVIPAGALDTAKVFDILVVNPGAGQSNSLPFTVLNPLPVLTNVAPDSANRLDTLQVVLTGSRIVPGFTSVVLTPPDNVTVSDVVWTDTAHISAKIAVAANAAIGQRSLHLSTVSPGGGNSQSVAFRIAGNPVPTLVSLEPVTVARLDTIVVYLNGTDFIDGITSVDFGAGISVDSFKVESTGRLRASLKVSPTAALGSRPVTVTNAGPGGGTSNGRPLQVNNPVPEFHSVTPSNGEQAQSYTIEINGRRFIQGVTTVNMGTGILINSDAVTNDTTIIADISITAAAGTGPRDISVSNAPPGGGVSILVGGFVVGANPAPELTGVDPDSGSRAGTMDVSLAGANFLGGITSVDFGEGIWVQNVDVDSSSSLIATVVIAPNAALGPRTVHVINRPPGGGRDSIQAAFRVVNPRPGLGSISPTSAIVQQTLTLSLTGAGFLPGVSSVVFADTAIRVNSVTVDSTTGMRASITVGANAAVGETQVVVVNAPPGGGTSGFRLFSVIVAAPETPVLSAPPDGTTDLATVLTLSWAPAARASSYRLEVSTTPTFSSKVVDQRGLTATSLQVGPLSNNTTHYWRVTASNAGGDSGPSVVWSFTPAYPSLFPLSQTIDFPSLSSSGDYRAQDYKIVGIPGNLNEPVTNLIPGSHQTDWDMYWDNGGATDYFVRYDGGNTFRFAQGRAFWLVKKGAWTVSRTVPSPALDTAGVTTIAVHAGWNLITNPFITPIPWAEIQALNGPISIEPLWLFDQFFATSTSMDPYEGYYFFNADNRATVRIPYPGFKRFSKPAAPDSGSWWAELVLRSGRHVDRDTRFGVHPAAAAARDGYDFHKPRGLGDVPGILFDRPEWDEAFPSFAADIRPSDGGLQQWDFDVRSRGRDVHQVMIEGLERIPGALDVVLLDRSRGKSQNLRESAAYSFTPAADVSKFSVAVGSAEDIRRAVEEAMPREFALGENFPNPFNPATTIPISVPRAADVSVRIYSIVGEEVAVLHQGPLEAGRYWMTWNARSAGGRAVATGVYLVRMTTGTGFSATKKMLLMK